MGNSRVFIIAEAGVNHNGSLELAKDGKSEYRVVVAKGAEEPIPAVAKEFVMFFEEITGVKLPIVSDAGPMREKEIIIGPSKHLANRISGAALVDIRLGHNHIFGRLEHLKLLGILGGENLTVVDMLVFVMQSLAQFGDHEFHFVAIDILVEFVELTSNSTDHEAEDAIRQALMDGPGFMVGGYFAGSIGPTGSGWIRSLKDFKIQNKPHLVNIPAQ